MAKGPLRFADSAGVAIRKITVWLSGAETGIATSPTITSGAGVPASTEADGSVYLRTDGAADTTVYVMLSTVWTAAVNS